MEINEFGIVTENKVLQATMEIEKIVKKLFEELKPLTNMEKRIISYQLNNTIDLALSENIIKETIINRKDKNEKSI